MAGVGPEGCAEVPGEKSMISDDASDASIDCFDGPPPPDNEPPEEDPLKPLPLCTEEKKWGPRGSWVGQKENLHYSICTIICCPFCERDLSELEVESSHCKKCIDASRWRSEVEAACLSIIPEWPPQEPEELSRQLSRQISRQGSDAAGVAGAEPREEGESGSGSGEDNSKHLGKSPDNVIFGMVRKKVSLNKKRWSEDGFNLDLSYITPNIIAMGFPSHGTEGIYRNPADEVQRFFEKRHRSKYRIFNLCSERHYSDPDLFHRNWEEFPFDDHCPPPMEMIPRFCAALDAFLAKHEDNVCAIHCKAGKGRTGMIIGCYLMYRYPELRTVRDALTFFAEARTRDGQGCTIPSQHRYCWYWEQCLRSEIPGWVSPEPRKLQFISIVVHSPIKPTPVDLYFQIHKGYIKERNMEPGTTAHQILFDSRKHSFSHKVPYQNNKYAYMFPPSLQILLVGDIRVTFYNSGYLKDDHLFHFWFHTQYCPNEFTLEKYMLDKATKDHSHIKYDAGLKVDVRLEE